MTTTETGESARLLEKLAPPLIGNCPDLDLQKDLVAALEDGIKQAPAKFDKYLLFVGAFELPVIPDASAEGALPDQVKLINLPSVTEAKGNEPIHALGTHLNGFPLAQAVGAERNLVRFSLLTMSAAHQLEYLRKSGFVGKEWKVLVEIHYYRKRQFVGRDRLHKDTYGETLFVNLNYDTDVDIPGPEYVLNPAVVQEHETQIERSLPAKFLEDLRWVRGRLGKPAEINIAAVKPHQFVAFVDEAIHHMSPQFGGRTVSGNQLGAFLAKTYGQDLVQDASAARQAFREANSGFGSYFRSLMSTAKPFAAYLKLVPADKANTWFHLMELVETPDTEVNRLGLRDAGLTDDVIDALFAEYWPGYQKVSVPGAKPVPVAETALKRQASAEALNKRVPPPAAGDRRFFRTWVRVVKA
ncbi:hypothetical protein [Amycolatopsis vancoresmycina]|uniref:Uncharacterized protein n=1 Tax=Amycolatopsis vancoresmycina DSM 44592 TaxID=1292037 RepID=R1ICH5_9PSEU|nr:hypothetical protein [Amycolatopsis vancoresmycina]EOD70231.1 hypothetical protein H480_02174 [Amycolatopsis vancoresmycina DSM 44592]